MANTSNRASNQATKDLDKYEKLVEKYGGSINSWKAAGVASLVGADIMDGVSAHSQLGIKSTMLGQVQDEVADRAAISIANISSQERKVVGMQKGHFVKSGVKLEGSAMDVIQETINNATKSMTIAQEEADFKQTQLNIQKKVAQFQQSTIATSTLLSIAGTSAKVNAGI